MNKCLFYLSIISLWNLMVADYNLCGSHDHIINVTTHESFLIRTTKVLDNHKNYSCKLEFQMDNSISDNNKILLMYLDLFELSNVLTNNSYAQLQFLSDTKVYATIRRYSTAENPIDKIITSRMLDQGFPWNKTLTMRIFVNEIGSIVFKLIVTILRDCTGEYKQVRCFQYNSKNYCIADKFLCDGIVHCPIGNIDESEDNCYHGIIDKIIIPFLVLIVLIIIVLWSFYKLLPCIFNFQQMLDQPTPNISPSVGHLRFIYATTQQEPPLIIPQNIQPVQSDSVLVDVKTPNSNIYSPPKYSSDINTLSESKLPPSYTYDSDVKIYPTFFKRFFGESSKNIIDIIKPIGKENATDNSINDSLNMPNNTPNTATSSSTNVSFEK